jgi:hypothetical protein
MKKLIFGLVAALAMTATTLPAFAGSSITVRNHTADAWVWVTSYVGGTFGREILKGGVYCLGPNDSRSNAYNQNVTTVRVEVTKRNCAHPVMLDRELGSKPITAHDLIFSGNVNGSNGTYSFTTSH